MYSNAFNSLSRFILTNVGVFSFYPYRYRGPGSVAFCCVLSDLSGSKQFAPSGLQLILNDIHILLAVYKPKFDFIQVTKQRSKPVIF